MKCLREESIQKYIDKETSEKEDNFIRIHLSKCTECREKFDNYLKSVDTIKKAIKLLDEKEIELPGFEKPHLPKKNKYRILRFLLIPAAAACILIFVLIFFQKEKNEVEMIYSYDLESEFNSNLPVTDQEMVIQIIDAEGQIFKY